MVLGLTINKMTTTDTTTEKPNQDVIDKIKDLMGKQKRRDSIKAEIEKLQTELTDIENELSLYGLNKASNVKAGAGNFKTVTEEMLVLIATECGKDGKPLTEMADKHGVHFRGLQIFATKRGFTTKKKDNVTYLIAPKK